MADSVGRDEWEWDQQPSIVQWEASEGLHYPYPCIECVDAQKPAGGVSARTVTPREGGHCAGGVTAATAVAVSRRNAPLPIPLACTALCRPCGRVGLRASPLHRGEGAVGRCVRVCPPRLVFPLWLVRTAAAGRRGGSEFEAAAGRRPPPYPPARAPTCPIAAARLAAPAPRPRRRCPCLRCGCPCPRPPCT